MPLAEGKSEKGISFRSHKTRKCGRFSDKYWMLRHTVNGKRINEGLGYTSDGMTQKKAGDIRELLATNKKANIANAGKNIARLPETYQAMQGLKVAEEEEAKLAELEDKNANEPFNTFFDRYIQDREAERPREELVRSRTQYRKWAQPIIGERPPRKITLFDMKRIVKAMTDGGSAPRTIIGVVGFIGQCYNHHITFNNYTGSNPVNRKAILPSKIKKHDNKRERYLTQDEADQLIKELPEPVKTMALMSLHMGFRSGELMKMKWADVNFVTGEIKIRDTKSGKPRTVVITQKVRSRLELMVKGQADEHLFTKPRSNKPLTELPRNYKTTVDELGFNDRITDRRQRVVFHTLRHTCASWLVSAGVDLYTVKEVLGHSSILVTERYVHGGAKLIECANIMDEITSPESKQLEEVG